jgi:glycine dehydrogenase subunit 1
VADYLPHTREETKEMLDFLGLTSIEQLFDHVPAALRLSQGLDMAPGMTEPDVAAAFAQLTARNRTAAGDLVCFAGAGAYDQRSTGRGQDAWLA